MHLRVSLLYVYVSLWTYIHNAHIFVYVRVCVSLYLIYILRCIIVCEFVRNRFASEHRWSLSFHDVHQQSHGCFLCVCDNSTDRLFCFVRTVLFRKKNSHPVTVRIVFSPPNDRHRTISSKKKINVPPFPLVSLHAYIIYLRDVMPSAFGIVQARQSKEVVHLRAACRIISSTAKPMCGTCPNLHSRPSFSFSTECTIDQNVVPYLDHLEKRVHIELK